MSESRQINVIDCESSEQWSWLVNVDGKPHTLILNSGITPDEITNAVEEANAGSKVALLRLGRTPLSYSRLPGERFYA